MNINRRNISWKSEDKNIIELFSHVIVLKLEYTTIISRQMNVSQIFNVLVAAESAYLLCTYALNKGTKNVSVSLIHDTYRQKSENNGEYKQSKWKTQTKKVSF